MDTFQPSAHYTWIKGRHTFKTGAEYYRISMERGAANIEEGQLNFSSQTCGYAFACFLLGRPANTQTPEGIPLTFPRANRWGTYINDDFKVNARLTLNLGLRFDYNGWGKDAKGLWRTLDIPGLGADIGRGAGYKLPDGTVIPTIFPGVLGEAGSVRLTKQQVRFFMPRLGIAFRPTEKTVIRMGGGWFDNIQHLNTFTIFNLMPPKAGSQAYQTSYVAAQNVAVNAVNGQTINVQTFKYAPGSPVLTLNDPFLTSTGGAAVVRPIDVSLRVVSVGGNPVNTLPTGAFVVPDVTVNSNGPLPVAIQAANVPIGTVVTLVIFSENGPDQSIQSTPLAGTSASSTATASVTLPSGFSKGFVKATFTQ